MAAAATASGQRIVVIKPDGTQATFTFPEEVKPSSGTVAPAGTKLAGTLLAWVFYGQGVATLSPAGSIGVLGGDTGVIAVAVVPKRS